MELQWIWNAQGNMLGRMEEGWISLNRNKPQWKAPGKRSEAAYKPWTTASDPQIGKIKMTDVKTHGFSLDKWKLPMQLLIHLSHDGDIEWVLPDA